MRKKSITLVALLSMLLVGCTDNSNKNSTKPSVEPSISEKASATENKPTESKPSEKPTKNRQSLLLLSQAKIQAVLLLRDQAIVFRLLFLPLRAMIRNPNGLRKSRVSGNSILADSFFLISV